MTPQEREIFERWIIDNVDETLVPGDEGNGDALLYNLMQRLRHGKGEEQLYNYLRGQDLEIEAWRFGQEQRRGTALQGGGE